MLADQGNRHDRDIDARLEEARGLALAIGLDVVLARAWRLRQARPATLFGPGQVEEIAALVTEHDAELVIVDNALAPVQQSNLEKMTNAKVIDRTGLILEIFGERAATAEGRLQVELAHLDYQAGRLVRSWTHLERQRGGFGFLGGPGETQIEADRRMIRDRMARIRRELDQVTRTRALHRQRRKRAPWPVVALVGYTNAGKSTLFNRLTGAEVTAEDMLFATLDPTLRAISLPGVEKVILSDTVGFVSDLPTQLIAAFRATLEEVVEADLILHVRDISHPDTDAQRADVIEILQELGVVAGEAEEGVIDATERPQLLEVWNKTDLLDSDLRAVMEERADRQAAVLISAVTGQGLDQLEVAIRDLLARDLERHRFTLGAGEGAAAAWLHQHGDVVSSITDEAGALVIDVRLSTAEAARFVSQYGRVVSQPGK